MRKIAAVLMLAVMALAYTTYAATKSYQFTGAVKSVTGDTFTVQKSATETWEFTRDASTKGTVKVGDRVTVHYRMVATEIEANPGAAKK
jgi:hypothetical protein